MKVVILGLSITSSWGNGHATTYRSLCRALHRLGHSILFVEKDVPWYRENRDLPCPDFCEFSLYQDWNTEKARLIKDVKDADVIVIGSYFPDAIAAADFLFELDLAPVLFYDIDTPVTLAALRRNVQCEYLRIDQIPRYAAYLSFSGGPILKELKARYGARDTFALYCSVDLEAHREASADARFAADLSYMGTYAADRQSKLLRLLDTPAQLLHSQRFLVAGPLYPSTAWAPNVRRLDHVAPADHASFYSSSRFTLNLTRDDMVEAGYSPSVRLFEAAACGAAILSDAWAGLDEFLKIGEEIVVVESPSEVADILSDMSDGERQLMGARARQRIFAQHTSRHRALEFEQIVSALSSDRSSSARLPFDAVQ